MKIIIGADLAPTETNIDFFTAGDADSIVGECLKAILSSADFRIFNLEVPITDEVRPIEKHGATLFAPCSSIKGISALKVDLISLANNHIMDQGKEGLLSTVTTLKNADIGTVGVGETADEAAKPFVFIADGIKIGVYSCAEHEFSIAGENSCGANPFDPLETPDHIAELKSECDKVIVLYHGGKELYRYPSPGLRKNCRKLIEKGADLVVCQHSHCIGCMEKYLDGTIVYGQGDFLFDRGSNELRRSGLLIQFDELNNVTYYPILKENHGVRLAEHEAAEQIISDFTKRSEEIKTEGFVEKQYEKAAEDRMDSYLLAMAGVRKSFIFKALNKLSGQKLKKIIVRRKYNDEQRLALRNYIECEAHRELLLRGLEKK